MACKCLDQEVTAGALRPGECPGKVSGILWKTGRGELWVWMGSEWEAAFLGQQVPGQAWGGGLTLC